MLIALRQALKLILHYENTLNINIQLKSMSSQKSQKKYVLFVEWFDPAASLLKQFYFTLYLPSAHIEMYDIKNQKMFLKKIAYPQIKIQDLYIGNVLICLGRQLKITGYADEFTRKQLCGEQASNKTYAMIKPNAYLNLGKIISLIEQSFIISNLKMFQFDQKNAQGFYAQHEGKAFFPKLIDFMTSDYSVGLELVANDAVPKWRKLLGPTDSTKAKTQAPKSIRGLYGQDGTRNAAHGSDSASNAQKQLNFIFGNDSKLKSRPYLQNGTLCIIKPHIIKSKQLGAVLDEILSSGFQISALQMIWFDAALAAQFYAPYAFLPECKRMIDHLASGPAVVCQVRQENAVDKFRESCGPYDPEIARKLFKGTLRAKFGVDRVMNAVHCTDLAEDGVLETQFVFHTILG